MPPPSVSVSLLGGFELTSDGRVVPVPGSVERVVAFLALHERALQRPFVAGALWPDVPEDRAGASLRSALWRLRRSSEGIVRTPCDHLGLAGGVTVDLHVATLIAHRILTASPGVDPPEGEGVILTGDLLPDWSEDWVLLERERFRQLRLHALERLCDQLAAAGRYGEATEAGLAAVAGEPLRESAHRALIRAYLAEGNRAEAIRQYDRFRTLLHEELGVGPSPFLEELVHALR